ncbi:hypothetical protein MAPG_08439 [Magnaporthiopsis poae ATCC 64411]|uniref:Uncharacterized protein n=1 Tax=Magnaporthiopsis poae (strain ATCC 64411 / 73-15) TaxID=644358 RepID=A0A0C4E7C7_MAGP6|nr:hypothetical protein MAPG_08439 [Magnaporthiopsis poae ATCC 64411]
MHRSHFGLRPEELDNLMLQNRHQRLARCDKIWLIRKQGKWDASDYISRTSRAQGRHGSQATVALPCYRVVKRARRCGTACPIDGALSCLPRRASGDATLTLAAWLTSLIRPEVGVVYAALAGARQRRAKRRVA